MRITIIGHHLPGRTFCNEAGQPYENVHVGVQEGREPVDLVPGAAPSARWDVDVRVVAGPDGGVDFRGPVVHGKRGERKRWRSATTTSAPSTSCWD